MSSLILGARWTHEEELVARRLRAEGASYREIGERLRRSEASVCQRLNSKDVFTSPVYRTRISFQRGAKYEIRPLTITSSSLYFLPATFVFIEEVPTIRRWTQYLFRSVKGGYLLCFTFPQIVGSYVIIPTE